MEAKVVICKQKRPGGRGAGGGSAKDIDRTAHHKYVLYHPLTDNKAPQETENYGKNSSVDHLAWFYKYESGTDLYAEGR